MTKAEYAFMELALERENAFPENRDDYEARIVAAVEAIYAERVMPETRDVFFDALTEEWVREKKRHAVVAGVPRAIVNRWYREWARTIRPQLEETHK